MEQARSCCLHIQGMHVLRCAVSEAFQEAFKRVHAAGGLGLDVGLMLARSFCAARVCWWSARFYHL